MALRDCANAVENSPEPALLACHRAQSSPGSCDPSTVPPVTDTPMQADRLTRWVTALLEAYGTPTPGAKRVAAALVDADRCGHRSHGVRQLPYYPIRSSAASSFPLRSRSCSSGAQRADPNRRPPRLRPAGRGAGDGDCDVGSHRALGRPSSRFTTPTTFSAPRAYTERIAAAGLVGILLANNQGDAAGGPLWLRRAPPHEQPHLDRGAGPPVLDIAQSAAAEGRVYPGPRTRRSRSQRVDPRLGGRSQHRP